MRGSGESDGVMHDQYSAEEQQYDALEVIDWIARQAWCCGTGRTMGKSWALTIRCKWPLWLARAEGDHRSHGYR